MKRPVTLVLVATLLVERLGLCRQGSTPRWPDRARRSRANDDGNRGHDNRGNDHRGNDNRGNDNRGNDNRGNDRPRQRRSRQ